MKRFISLALCLLLVLTSADAAMSVRLDEGALLLSRDGSIIVPLGAHEDIVPLGGDLFAALRDGRWGLMDADGGLLTEALYSELRPVEDVLLARKEGLWGLVSRSGDPLGDFAYTMIVPGGDGNFWAVKGNVNDLESDEIFGLRADGGEEATGLFVRRMGDTAAEGLLPVLRPGSRLWGYCDAVGEMIIAAKYSHAGSFISGRAAVVENGRYGVIDAKGNAVIAPEYDYLEISPSGFILASQNLWGAWVFDLDGNELARFEGEETAAALVGDGYAVYDGEWLRVYDSGGAFIAEVGQSGAVTEGVNGQLILSDGAWGEKCVRLSGADMPEGWQHIYPLGTAGGEGIYACMQANSARYINDLLGEVQLSMDMESARYGVLDSKGALRIPVEFESIEYLEDDRLLMRVDEYWQVADTSGNIYWTHGVRQIEEPTA